MFFADRLTLDKPRRTADGYMAIRAKAARTGLYQYLGREIDPEGAHFTADQIVNVYRPPEEVFDAASLASFVGKPVTDNHPAEGVDASNWRDLARGTVMGAIRDGEHVGFDLAFMDAGLIAQIDAGKRELSNGYEAKIEIGDGTTPAGEAYQAVQRTIRGNHVAVVDEGRAGSSCCIADAAHCAPIASDEVMKFLVDQRTYDAARDKVINDGDNNSPHGVLPVPKFIIIDGHQIDISNVDTAEATIKTLQGQIADGTAAAATAQGQIAQLTADKATLDTENKALKAKLDDARITPEMLRDAAKRFADVSAKAKALGVTVADDADEIAIKRAVVDAKLGDDAKGWTDEQVEIGFTALAKDAKSADEAKPDAMADAIRSGIKPIGSAKATISDARRHYLNRKETAYMGNAA